VAKSFAVVKRAELFCSRHEPSTIRGLGLAFNEQMHVIWHEAVDDNFNLFVLSCARKLRTHKIDRFP
jgi:hypothetical protein